MVGLSDGSCIGSPSLVSRSFRKLNREHWMKRKHEKQNGGVGRQGEKRQCEVVRAGCSELQVTSDGSSDHVHRNIHRDYTDTSSCILLKILYIDTSNLGYSTGLG